MDDFYVLFDARVKPGAAAWRRATERLGSPPEVLYVRSDFEPMHQFLIDESMIIEVDDSLPPGHWALGLQRNDF